MNYFSATKKDEYKNFLIIQPDAGLGNRLYCLYSAAYYSVVLKRRFKLIWLRENCCNVPFDELFDTKSPEAGEYFRNSVRTTYHLGYKSGYALRTIASNIFMKYIMKKYDYHNSEETRAIFNQGGENAILKLLMEDKRICVKANGKFFDLDHFDTVREVMVPAKDIEQMVVSIMQETQYSENVRVIGIHIRRTDNKNSIENSPLEAFEARMKEEMDLNPNVVFYLATDDDGVEKYLGSKYNLLPHKTFGNTKSRNSTSGIKDAYVDMLCLSRCDKIYGSYGSSFSEMAALIGDKPIEIVTK